MRLFYMWDAYLFCQKQIGTNYNNWLVISTSQLDGAILRLMVWCWEGLGAGGEGDDRGWDGWMASLTRWTWVWVNSGSWWWTGSPGVLQFMGWQRVGHDWATERKWTEGKVVLPIKIVLSPNFRPSRLFTFVLFYFYLKIFYWNIILILNNYY